MKNYNKILEAINRGIQLALDDYEEQQNEPIAPKKEIIKNNNSTKKLIQFYDNFVDLGLPSGTLWAKYNLGVDPNKLSKPEDWYGDYYAWGETIPNKSDGYNLETYQFDKDLIKYNKEDNLTELQFMDDPVYQNIHNFKFRMPTKEQFKELIEKTNNEWVENFNGSGVNGCKFTSKSDSSKYIFLPATGACYDSDLLGVGEEGYYWSSSRNIDNPGSAWYLCLVDNDGDDAGMGSSYRYGGFSIRSVINL